MLFFFQCTSGFFAFGQFRSLRFENRFGMANSRIVQFFMNTNDPRMQSPNEGLHRPDIRPKRQWLESPDTQQFNIESKRVSSIKYSLITLGQL
jgi:hypothetical protein